MKKIICLQGERKVIKQNQIKSADRMSTKQMAQSQQGYFSNLVKRLQSHTPQSGFRQTAYPQTVDLTEKCIEDAIDEIMFGMIEFKQTSDRVQKIIKVPLHKKIGSDIHEIDKKIQQNQEMLKQAKRQMLIHKRQQQQAMKLQHQIKARQNAEKIRVWAEHQRLYNEKRQQLFQKREKLIQQDKQRLKEQKQQQQQQQIQERKRSVEKRLKAMQQQRQKRQQVYSQGLEEYKSIKQPKFKEIQKKYEKVVAEQNFEKQIIKKNIKIAKQLNFNLIKQHDKQYIEKLSERMKQKGYSSHKLLNQQEKQLYESRFKNLLKRTDQEIEQERQKFKRRKNFQQRLSEIPLEIDDGKKIKIEIARDKAKNPLKYNFLRQKQLNDYQIYMEFKDFELDIDRNQLGKSYLQEAKKIGSESRIKKSHSVSAISLKHKEKQQKYRDYLPQIRAHRSAYTIQNNPTSKKSIEQVFRRESNKQRAIEKISTSLRKYDDSIKDKKIQLRTLNTISSTLKKQREIDEMYMKSLKAKLACLEIH